MRLLRCSALAVGVLAAVATTAPVRAEDDAKVARGVIDKAIKAHGGAENVKKYPGAVSAFKGTFRGMGMELPMSGEITILGATKVKVALEIEAGGQKISVVNVVDGNKGWAKVADTVTELDKDQMTEAVERQHAGWVASLTPLVDGKGFTLATTGEHKVGEAKAVGVKVSAKGKRDVDLYFDKETGLLLKHESRVKDEGSGQEVTEETFHSEYKEVQGTKQAMKVVTKRDGKDFMDAEMSSIQLSEKVDDTVFVKP